MLSTTVCIHTRINASTTVYKYIDINAGIVLCTVNSLITLWSGGTIWFPLCALPCQYVCGRMGLSLGPILMLCAFAGSVIERSGPLSINDTGVVVCKRCLVSPINQMVSNLRPGFCETWKCFHWSCHLARHCETRKWTMLSHLTSQNGVTWAEVAIICPNICIHIYINI